MAEFRVTSAELRTKADQLKQLAENFKNAVEQLGNTEQTLASMWEGEAQAAFRTAFNNDCTQFTNFYKGILKYVQTLLNDAQRYENAEKNNVQIATTRKA